MLAATRDPRHGVLTCDDRPIPVFDDLDGRALEAWFRRVASATADQRFRFERREIGRRDGVELVADRPGETLERVVRIQMGRVIWSQSFADVKLRDRFHHWLCLHLDRWDEWGRQAWERGPTHLTHVFLEALAKALPIVGAAASAAPSRIGPHAVLPTGDSVSVD